MPINSRLCSQLRLWQRQKDMPY